jgi:predicted RNA polymerase sigma factor
MTPFDLPSARAPEIKRGEDTVQGCRDRATADLLQAVIMMTANQRLRLEQSAHGWTLRADMLDRLNKSFEKRAALDRASRQYKTDHVRL